MSPLVSVVVPVFNGLPYLPSTLASVLSQTHQNLELVIADGGSTDGSPRFIDEVAGTDPRIRVVEGAPGAAANWTAVTEQAHGQFIKLLCQDDVLTSDAIAKQVDDLMQHQGAVVAVAQRDIIDARGRTVTRARGLQGIKAGTQPFADLVRRCFDYGTNVIGEPLAVLFRREPLLAAMPWSDANPLMLDVVTYERIADLEPRARAVVRRESIGAFRVSTSSWSTRIARFQRIQFQAWQADFATKHPDIGERKSGLAYRAACLRALERRLAYALLQARGSFRAAG